MQETLTRPRVAGRRGFMNGATAAIHEDIVMNDRIFESIVEVCKATDPAEAGRIIERTWRMVTGKSPEGIDWKGIAKSLASSV